MLGLFAGVNMIKWGLILAVVASVLGAGGYYYYTTNQTIETLQNDKELMIANAATLQGNVATLTGAVDQSKQTVEHLEASYRKIQQDFNSLQAEFQLIQTRNGELAVRLGRHELDVLAAAKPNLVEATINKATVNAFRCFEIQSGAPFNETEIKAASAQQANSECPWLYTDVIGK